MHSRAKERAKLLTAIAGVALIVAAVVGIAISLMSGMPSGGGISGQVTIQPYTEDSLADMDAKGTFCIHICKSRALHKGKQETGEERIFHAGHEERIRKVPERIP